MVRSEHQDPLLREAHRNHYLFSDYYLNNRIQEHSDWRSLDVEAEFVEFKRLWRDFTPNGNEAQTEQDWIRPVLMALGHIFNVQVRISTPLGNKIPDYIFYLNSGYRQVHIGAEPLREHDLQGALAVGDAKAWDRPLDQPIRVGHHANIKTSENPSFQIDFYIRHTGLRWGILTNGRQWRLYHTDTSKKLDTFYEVDLPALIEQDDTEAFKYFYLFFRNEAFIGDPCWLETVLTESQVYEQGISDALKDQVYEALHSLAQGFLNFPTNDLQPTAETLKAIYDNSLIVLYRLLFILYAESRQLLPVHENIAYTESYSLYALKNRIASDLSLGKSTVSSMSGLWEQLRQLWQIVDKGNSQLSVPAYNGGLFDPAQHLFLENYRVGDIHLRQAIDLLARAEDPATGQREFVDYRDLEVRHLGSIYEGLLEYQLRYTDEPLAVRREAKRELYVALGTTNLAPTIRAGQVYLVTDNGERKASGSYYTPDYIVQYIIEQTVGPALENTRQRFVDGNGTINDEAGLVRAILDLNVLDPAMGSGHFLVAATDYIARYLVGLGLEMAVSLSGEGEFAYWRRRVVQACIYGVDLNYLAVELAKLSLWLNTVAKDKPLSFLDHHLRCGNSLVGARVDDLQLTSQRRSQHFVRKEKAARAAGQISMLDDSIFIDAMRTATGSMGQIEALKSETIADVREAKNIYQNVVQTTTNRFRRLANVWTARHFGLEIDNDLWNGLVQYLIHGGFEVPRFQESVEKAERIAEERRFFHWELEFPEVFFTDKGHLLKEAGFDAVVGNPPYSNAWAMTSFDSRSREAIELLSGNSNLLTGHWDLYTAFTAIALEIVKERGFHSFIVPDALAREKYAKTIREYILKTTSLREIMHFEGVNVFDEVSRHCIIYVLSKVHPGSDTVTRILVPLESGSSAIEVGTVKQRSWLNSEGSQIRPELADKRHQRLSKKITDNSVRVGDFCYVMVGATVHSKDKKSFIKATIVSEKPVGNAKKFFDGKSVSRYAIEWDGRYLDYRRDEMYGPRVPELFESPKVVVRDVTGANEQLIVSFDGDNLYCDHLVTCLTYYENVEGTGAQVAFDGYERTKPPHPDLLYLTAILASKLITWYFRKTFATGTLQGSYSHTYPQQVRALPIRRISFFTSQDERQHLLTQYQQFYHKFCNHWDNASLLEFVNQQLHQKPERTDIVHDLLAFLAGQMIALYKQRLSLKSALDPFKYLDAGVKCVPLSQAMAQEIKYGQLLRSELSRVRHDVDALRLIPADDQWELQAFIKLRTGESDWQSWQYEDDGKTICRQWVSVYRLPINDFKAQYYKLALPVRSHFANAKPIPGGRTRTTYQKLQLVHIPVYLPETDLTPLIELIEEVAAVRMQIEHTDVLIDEVVYRLYGLTKEEIVMVEGSK